MESKILEQVNYSSYTADLTIQVNKYIGERKTSLYTMITRALQGDTSLLIAPTGAGKTNSLINILKEIEVLGDVKSIFVVPNAINVEQIKKEYSIPGAWGEIPALQELEKGNVIVMTWDKFIQLDEEILKDYIVVLDEVHQIYIDMFRLGKINRLYENLGACRGQIHITATPNKLNFNNYNYILEYKQNIQTKYNVKLYDKICDDTICNIIRTSNKFALLRNDTDYLNLIKENNPNKNIDVITKDTRGFSQTYNDIVFNGTIGDVKGICNTSVLIAGVNIKEPNITDIIIVGEKDIATIKQYVARFRDLKEVNVHIFNNYSDEPFKTYSIEWLVNKRLEQISIDIDYYNKKNITDNFVEQLLDLSPIRLNNSQEYYWSNKYNKYIVSDIGIRNTCYTKYYSKADIYSYKELLKEYFPNIDIVNIDVANNEPSKLYKQIANEEKKEVLEILSQDKNILVGATEILTNKVTSKTETYLNNNGTVIEDLKEELIKKGIDNYLLVGNIAKIINLYSKYVIENGYNYNLAWSIANKGNRARGKFFNQLNNITYREIENKYPKLMRYIKIEDKLYNFIVKMFIPGISYTEEHLKDFIEAVEITIPGVKLTTNKLGEILGQIYSIESRELNSVEGIDFLFKEIYNPILSTKKKKRINTIKSFLTIEDVIEQNKLDDLSLKVLKNLIDKRIEDIEKEAIEIASMQNIFTC